MNYGVCGLVVLNCAAFGWAAFKVFRSGMTDFRWNIVRVGAMVTGVAEVAALLQAPGAAWQRWMACAAMLVASQALFVWATQTIRQRPLSLAFSNDAPQFLTRTGPYRWVRHPFYTAYMATYLAGCVASDAWMYDALVLAMIALYVYAARTEQAKFARSNLRDAYAAYVRSTGMFLPLPWALWGARPETVDATPR